MIAERIKNNTKNFSASLIYLLIIEQVPWFRLESI